MINCWESTITLFFSKPVNHTVCIYSAFQLTVKSIHFVHLCANILTQKQM